ncbi:MAG TPA: VWA-like domain-containing protein [Acidimicrobiales bacterium]|nr:VWA-like domain-containing protein [Acidimicrobiales bacterium]
MNEAVERRVAMARLWAVARHPYLAAALFASPVVPVEGLGRVTVDEAWRLYVDPELVERWKPHQLGSLLVHHAGHLVRDHAGRARSLGVDQHLTKDWRLAADAEINDDLIGDGLSLPTKAVLPQHYGWHAGRLAEEYFHADHPDHGDDPDCGSGSDAQTRPWELLADERSGLPPGDRHLTRAQVAADVLRFCEEGRGRGASKSWLRWAEDMLDPQVDWRRMLAAEIRKGVGTVAGVVDYSYRRPSRRAQACPDVVLPAMERPVPEVVVLCDTSGSMGERQLARLLAEVDGLLRGVGMRGRLRVLAVDTAVHALQRVASARSLELRGGGGTDMAAGVEAAARLRPRPSVVVVLTDGLTPWPASPPKGMVVVVGLIGGGRPKGNRVWAPPDWARVVHIDEAA